MKAREKCVSGSWQYWSDRRMLLTALLLCPFTQIRLPVDMKKYFEVPPWEKELRNTALEDLMTGCYEIKN